MTKKALITGITGQDGSYLAELLLKKDYEVVGLRRRTSTENTDRLPPFFLHHPSLTLVEGELSDPISIRRIIEDGQFDEVYNCAAMSHVHTSFEQPDYTFRVNTLGPTYLLESIRNCSPHTRMLQCSTSEMWGKNYDIDQFGKYQDENTTFAPQSPYAVAKLATHDLCGIYRQAYGLHVSCSITHNHESERRGENFVTRKITLWIANFLDWLECDLDELKFESDVIRCDGATIPKLRLGNINAYRDWGYAKDYVEAFWLMLQQQYPDDYVISTGKAHSVRDFLDVAFRYAGLGDYDKYIVIDPKFYRPAEVNYLRGRSDRIETELGWKPKTTFTELVQKMVDSDVKMVKHE